MIPLEHTAARTEYGTLRAAIDEAVAAAVSAVTPHELRAAVTHAVTGGKRVRPLLCTLMCRAVGGNAMDALEAASGIELLHASSLVHDDIMDASPTRRGRPTVDARYGTPAAVLAGDTLIALAFRAVRRAETASGRALLGIFTEAFLQVCEGQGLDLHPDPSGGRLHRSMVEKKTAKLIEASAVIGATLGTTDARMVRRAGTFGRCIGMAFQAHDDLLDAVGDEEIMGKPSGLDRRNNRQTFLSLAYSAEEPTVERALDSARKTVAAYTGRACRFLDALPASDARDLLRDLAVALAGRLS